MEIHGTLPASVAEFRMIDIGAKLDTQRRALASGEFTAQESTLARVRERTLPKGDALILAEVAGIQGAKQASSLLPLCHPLSLTSVRVWFEFTSDSIQVFCEAKTVGKTGVEMEALAGVSAALLCIYDLTKGIDPVLGVRNIRLDLKEGGKSGQWSHPASAPSDDVATAGLSKTNNLFEGHTVSIITLSDRASRGTIKDESGPAIAQWFLNGGAGILSERILSDDSDSLSEALKEILEKEHPSFLISTGGTGLSPRDITPETMRAFALKNQGREIPGIGELLRSSGSRITQHAWLSRSTAFLVNSTLLVCLPGSPKAVLESLNEIAGLLCHAMHTVEGGGHDSLNVLERS